MQFSMQAPSHRGKTGDCFFLSFQIVCLPFLSCLTVVIRTSSIRLNNHLTSSRREKTFSASPLSVLLGVGFWWMLSARLRDAATAEALLTGGMTKSRSSRVQESAATGSVLVLAEAQGMGLLQQSGQARKSLPPDSVWCRVSSITLPSPLFHGELGSLHVRYGRNVHT